MKSIYILCIYFFSLTNLLSQVQTDNFTIFGHEKPFISSKIKINIPPNSLVTVLERGDFFKVLYLNDTCYINPIGLKKVEVQKDSITNSKTVDKDISEKSDNLPISKRMFTIKENSTIYKKPSYYSGEVKGFVLPTEVSLLSYSNGFYYIKSTNGKTGYIANRDLDLLNVNEYFKELDINTINSAKKLNKKILIKGAFISEVNSADGVNVGIDWLYLDNTKEIKYIDFTVIPFNRVGDIQRCRTTGESTQVLKITGPISSEDSMENLDEWENVWYNSTISCVKITQVKVQYFKGPTKTYIKDLNLVMDSNYSNDCKY